MKAAYQHDWSGLNFVAPPRTQLLMGSLRPAQLMVRLKSLSGAASLCLPSLPVENLPLCFRVGETH